jgi:hypothetical protein
MNDVSMNDEADDESVTTSVKMMFETDMMLTC